MENNLPFKIWQECKEIIPFGVLNGFISQIQKFKPHIAIETLQFLKVSHNVYTKVKYDYWGYGVGDNLYHGEDFTVDYEDTIYIQNYKTHYQQDKFSIVRWAYFKAFDSQELIYKTLKVQFLEIRPRNVSRFKDVIDQLKEKVLNQVKNDILLTIYDYYFLSEIGEDDPQYFVIEQELVEQTFTNYLMDSTNQNKKPVIYSYQQKSFLSCLRQLGVQVEIDYQNLAIRLARFYLIPQKLQNGDNHNTEKGDNQNMKKGKYNNNMVMNEMEEEKEGGTMGIENIYNLKLSPFDFYPYLAIVDGTSKALREQQENMDEEQAQQNDDEDITIKLFSEFISSNFLLEFLQTNEPMLLELHLIAVSKMVESQPQLNEYQLQDYDENCVSFNVKNLENKSILHLIKQKDDQVTQQVKSLFEVFRNLNLLSSKNKCEILSAEGNVYVMYTQYSSTDQTTKVYSLQNLIDFVDNEEVIKQTKQSLIVNLFAWFLKKMEELENLNLDLPLDYLTSIRIEVSLADNSMQKIYFEDFFETYIREYPTFSEHPPKIKDNFLNLLDFLFDKCQPNTELKKELTQYLLQFRRNIEFKTRDKMITIADCPSLHKFYSSIKILNKYSSQFTKYLPFKLLLDPSISLFITALDKSLKESDLILMNHILQEKILLLKCSFEVFEQIINTSELPIKVVNVIIDQNIEKIHPILDQIESSFSKLMYIHKNVHSLKLKNVHTTVQILPSDQFQISSETQMQEEFNIQYYESLILDLDPKKKKEYKKQFWVGSILEDAIEILKQKQFKKVRIPLESVIQVILEKKCGNTPEFSELNQAILCDNPSIKSQDDKTDESEEQSFEIKEDDQTISEQDLLDCNKSQLEEIQLEEKEEQINLEQVNQRNKAQELLDKEIEQIKRSLLHSKYFNIGSLRKSKSGTNFEVKFLHYAPGNQQKNILKPFLKMNGSGRLEVVSFKTENKARYSPKCCFSNIKSLVELYKIWVIDLNLVNTMKLYLVFQEIHECIHCDLNQFILKFYQNQFNLQEMDIDLKWCKQTVDLLNRNTNYLGFNSDRFNNLKKINIILPSNLSIELAIQVAEGISKNIENCKSLTHITIIYNQNINELITVFQKLNPNLHIQLIPQYE